MDKQCEKENSVINKLDLHFSYSISFSLWKKVIVVLRSQINGAAFYPFFKKSTLQASYEKHVGCLVIYIPGVNAHSKMTLSPSFGA